MLDRFEKFSLAISEINRYWHKLAAEELAPYGLKAAHATYLTAMYRHREGITVPELCEECGKDKSDASRMLAILEEKGLVTRSVSDRDARRRLITLTEKGAKLEEQLHRAFHETEEMMMEGLSGEERELLFSCLERVIQNLEEDRGL